MKINSRKLLIHLVIASSVIASQSSFAITGNATPSQYSVNLQKVAFHQSGAASNSFITYASGSSNIDIAAVSPGQPCGSLAPSAPLPSGTYDQLQVTISKTMVLKGSSNGNLSNGKPCRTIAGGALVTDPFGDGSISSAYLGSTDGAAAESETVIVPSGTAVTLPSGMTTSGDTLTQTVSATVNVANSVPSTRVSFDVTSGMLFEPLGANQCIVFPVPPGITIT